MSVNMQEAINQWSKALPKESVITDVDLIKRFETATDHSENNIFAIRKPVNKENQPSA